MTKKQATCAGLLLALFANPTMLFGQELDPPSPASQPPPSAQAAAASGEATDGNPSRPSNSHSAELLSPGLLQLEYGWLREWETAGSRQSAFGDELRFGILRNLEFRWGTSPYVSYAIGAGQQNGFGDQFFTGEYHFLNQSAHVPALAASYSIKGPTASDTKSGVRTLRSPADAAGQQTNREVHMRL
jgi:hypothetical protein